MSAVHQFVPTFEPGAVGAHTLAVRDVFRSAGYESEIFTSESRPAFAHHGARDYRDYGRRVRARDDDRLVYHLAIGSVVADFVAGRREPLIVDHHNLTPLRYLAGWEPVAAGGVLWGRRQLDALAGRSALGIGDSSYNEAELIAAGYPQTTVVPIIVDLDEKSPPDVALLDRLTSNDGPRWLFVGRVAPHKAQHDVIKAFAAYHRFYDSSARLFLVGGSSSDLYDRALSRFADELGLTDAVTLTGSVTDAELSAYYAAADVFVILSEHEGFCVPLLEAMDHRVPIVGYAAGAVPETLDGAGLLLDEKAPCSVAAAVARVIDDRDLHERLAGAGVERRRAFASDVTGPAFVAAVESVTTG